MIPKSSLGIGARTLGIVLFCALVAGLVRGSEDLQLRVVVGGRCEAEAHDSGRVLYLVTGRDCDLSGPVDARIFYGAGVTTLHFTAYGEEKVARISGVGLRRIGLFRRGQWRSFSNEEAWAPRDGAGLLYLDGYLFLLGGWEHGNTEHGHTTNEVWRTADLENWEFLGNAQWSGRHGAAWLVHDGRMWVIGGDLNDDVWSSQDGINWVLETSSAPFGRRYTPNAASVTGQIVVFAGQRWEPIDWCEGGPANCRAVGYQDVWASPDGRDWTLVTPRAPWAERALIHGAAPVVDGEILLIGGGLKAVAPGDTRAETTVEHKDIWSSPDGGRTWRKRLEAYSMAGRTHFSVVASPKGCFLTDGSVGLQTNVSNDVQFAADCLHYWPVPDAPPMQARHASSAIYFNGSLVVLGGPMDGGAGTEVWQYFD